MTIPITIETYYSFEAATGLSAGWDSFMAGIDAEIFLSYSWLSIWWRYYGRGRDLRIFVFSRENKIIGILPLMKEQFGFGPFSMRAIKIAGTDFLPIAVCFPVSPESLPDVISLLTGKLKEWGKWDLLYFGALAGLWHNKVDALVLAAKKAFPSCSVDKKQSDVQTYFEIAATWDEQIGTFSTKQRKEMKRVIEKYKKPGALLTSEGATDKNLPEFFDGFVKTHQEHWQSMNKPGHFLAWPKAYEFHREVASVMLAQNRLRLFRLMINNENIGYSYAYKFGTTYYRFLYARNTGPSAGAVPYAKVDFYDMHRRAVAEGITRYDAMRGDYDYKKQLGGVVLPISGIYITPRPGIKTAVFRLMFFCYSVVYIKIWRSRIAPALHFNIRPFRISWLRSHMLSM
jgi:CelD/BcsL family acetyltransferase involved in cellulose biosynthesis